MSFWSYRKAVFGSSLNSTTKLVLLCLDHHVNANGDPVWPSISRVVELTSLSRRAVLTHLKLAEELGWITVERRTDQTGRNTSSLYTLTSEGVTSNEAEFDGARGAPSPDDDGAGGAPTMVHEVHHWNRPEGKCVPVLVEQVQEESAQVPAWCVGIPLIDGTEFFVDEVLTHELQVAYPATDALMEFGKMRAWSITNPRRRKTKRGIMRFINSWLSAAQDKGGSYKASGGEQKGGWLDSLLGRNITNGYNGNIIDGGATFAARVG